MWSVNSHSVIEAMFRGCLIQNLNDVAVREDRCPDETVEGKTILSTAGGGAVVLLRALIGRASG